VDHVLHTGGILNTLTGKVRGTVDPAAGTIDLTLTARAVRDTSGGKGEGSDWSITGTLRGLRRGGAAGATTWWADRQEGWENGRYTNQDAQSGTLTLTHRVLNGRIPPEQAARMTPEQIEEELRPKVDAKVVTFWSIDAIAGPVAVEETAKPEQAPLRRTFGGGIFTFDQLEHAVLGTIQLPDGVTGLVFGSQHGDAFEFDWYDGHIKGQARLTRQPDGSWKGGTWREQYSSSRPPDDPNFVLK
jgi:hypothetical protein